MLAGHLEAANRYPSEMIDYGYYQGLVDKTCLQISSRR
jgi:hypothetical protein